MKKVFITRRIPSVAKKILQRRFNVDESIRNKPYPYDMLPEIVIEYDAILSTVSEKFDKKILNQKKTLGNNETKSQSTVELYR